MIVTWHLIVVSGPDWASYKVTTELLVVDVLKYSCLLDPTSTVSID